MILDAVPIRLSGLFEYSIKISTGRKLVESPLKARENNVFLARNKFTH